MVESYGPFPMNSRCVYWALLTVDKIMGSAISLLSRTSIFFGLHIKNTQQNELWDKCA